MKRPVLVIGATGQTGREVCRILHTRGILVRAFSRDSARAARTLGPDIELVTGDLRDSDAVQRAVNGVDAIILITPDGADQGAHECALIAAATRADVAQIIKISAYVAAQPASSRFGVQHARAERCLHETPVAWTVLRPNFFMQNFFSFARLIAERRLILAPFADVRFSMVDTRDLAEAACAVLGQSAHASQTYEITGPEPLHFHDAAAILSRELGAEIRYRPVPGFVAGLAMLAERVPWYHVRGRLEVFALIRDGHQTPNTDAVQRLTGQPPRGFAEFVRDHRHAFVPAAK